MRQHQRPKARGKGGIGHAHGLYRMKPVPADPSIYSQRKPGIKRKTGR
jgi:hypothetical protein